MKSHVVPRPRIRERLTVVRFCGEERVSIVAFAEDYGDRRGKLVGLCGNLKKVMTEEGFLTTYQDFFANVLKNGDATREAGTRVRKGMQELKRLLKDVRKEVQAMKNNQRMIHNRNQCISVRWRSLKTLQFGTKHSQKVQDVQE